MVLRWTDNGISKMNDFSPPKAIQFIGTLDLTDKERSTLSLGFKPVETLVLFSRPIS